MGSFNEFIWKQTDNVLFFDLSTDYLIGRLDLVQNCSISNSADSEDLKGGPGLGTVMTVKSNKSATIAIENAVAGIKEIGLLTGVAPIKGTKDIIFSEILTLNATKKGNLTKKSYGILDVYKLDSNEYDSEQILPTSGYTISAQEITVTSGASGDKIRVYYKVKSALTESGIKNEFDKFAKSVKTVINGVVQDRKDGALKKAQFIAYKAELSDSFAISMNNGNIPDPISFELKVLMPVTGTTTWELNYYTETGIESI